MTDTLPPDASPADGPVRLAAVIGSLRRESLHRSLFHATAALLPDDVTIDEVPIRDVPFYDGDVEAAGDPATVVALKAAIADADGVVFFSPEYNRSVPAVVKNVVDWASRPFRAGAIAGKPVAIVAGSPGGHDASGVRDALAHTAGSAGGAVYEPTFGIARVADAVVGGRMADSEVSRELTEWLAGFAAEARAARAG